MLKPVSWIPQKGTVILLVTSQSNFQEGTIQSTAHNLSSRRPQAIMLKFSWIIYERAFYKK